MASVNNCFPLQPIGVEAPNNSEVYLRHTELNSAIASLCTVLQNREVLRSLVC